MDQIRLCKGSHKQMTDILTSSEKNKYRNYVEYFHRYAMLECGSCPGEGGDRVAFRPYASLPHISELLRPNARGENKG